MYLSLVVEDLIQLEIIKKAINESENVLSVHQILGMRGNEYIRRNLRSFNEASRITPFLVVTDLDNRPCPSSLIQEWINFNINKDFIFQIAVREAEAWLIADRANFSKFIGISPNKVSPEPEKIADPKQYIVRLAHSSRKRTIRENLIPRGSASVGPMFNSTIVEFIKNDWDFKAAIQRAKSLERLFNKLTKIG